MRSDGDPVWFDGEDNDLAYYCALGEVIVYDPDRSCAWIAIDEDEALDLTPTDVDPEDLGRPPWGGADA